MPAMIREAPYSPTPEWIVAGVDLCHDPVAFLSDPATPGLLNRYSMVAVAPALILTAWGASDPILATLPDGEVRGEFADFAAALRFALRALPPSSDALDPLWSGGSPPFTGGLAGYLAYEFGVRFDRMPQRTLDPGWPALRLGLYGSVYIADHVLRRAWWLSRADSCTEAALRDRMVEGFEVLQRTVEKALPIPVPGGALGQEVEAFRPVPDWRGDWTPSLDPKAYERAFERIQRYLREGDIYQANLTVRHRRAANLDPRRLFVALMAANPAPFSAYLGTPETSVLSSSPELLLDLSAEGQLLTRPIKGTIALAEGSAASAVEASSRKLLASPKDRAEHLMIVDLERHDLGRVCRTGSVRVDPLFAVEKYRGLQHLVSGVSGRLRSDLGPADAIAALFPGGSVTGAPKIRAMEIIHALEPVPRGVYTGAIGWVSPEGGARMNLGIRTLAYRPGCLDLHVGGGIVVDSQAGAEFEECRLKGEAMARAVATVLQHLPRTLAAGPNCFAVPDPCC